MNRSTQNGYKSVYDYRVVTRTLISCELQFSCEVVKTR